MIPVRGMTGQKVAVLGLGRSGLSAARALAAGWATPVCWDDNPAAREKADAEGFACQDLRRQGAFDAIATLIVSPGIPHLYPEPNPVVAAALRLFGLQWDEGQHTHPDERWIAMVAARAGVTPRDTQPDGATAAGSLGTGGTPGSGSSKVGAATVDSLILPSMSKAMTTHDPTSRSPIDTDGT